MSEELCPKCNKPRTSKSGSITQWVNVCICDLTMDTDAESLPICNTCGKMIRTARKGSITQFVFGPDSCNCQMPKPIAGQQAVPQRLFQGFISVEEVEEIEEESLDLSEEDFPIARYKPLKSLGQGGNGEVFLAEDQILKKMVAVKVLHVLTSSELIQFQEEARATSKLNHPNIIDILDFGSTEAGSPYMVLEYFPGITLSALIKKHEHLSWEQTKAVIQEVSSGLSYAHKQKIFHRDITPANILIAEPEDSSIQVRLIDFGVAKVSELTGFVTEYQGKTIAGTPYYMSPDVAKGYTYSAASEIYSLGCIVYECLTGKPPFVGETALEVLSQHAKSQPSPLSELESQESLEEATRVVSRTLAKEPAERYQSVEQLLQDLNSQLEVQAEKQTEVSDQVVATVSTIQEPIQSKKPKTIIWITALGAFSLLAIFLFSDFLFNHDPIKDFEVESASKVILKNQERMSGSDDNSIWSINDESTLTFWNKNANFVKMENLTSYDIVDMKTKDVLGLSFREVENFDPKAITTIARNPQFTKIRFFDSNGLNDRCLSQLIKELKFNVTQGENIEVFVVSNCPNVSDKSLHLLGNLQRLREVKLNKVSVTNETVKALQELPINTLVLNDLDIDDGVFPYLRNIKELNRLVVLKNRGVSHTALEAFKRSRPKVTVGKGKYFKLED